MMVTPGDLLGSSSRKANWRRWTRSRPDSNFSPLVNFPSFCTFRFDLHLSETFLAMMLYDSSFTSNSMKLSPLAINFIGPHVFAIEVDWNNNWYEHTQHSKIFPPAHYINLYCSTCLLNPYLRPHVKDNLQVCLPLKLTEITLLVYSILIIALMLKKTFKAATKSNSRTTGFSLLNSEHLLKLNSGQLKR